jgi:hypothetical protein
MLVAIRGSVTFPLVRLTPLRWVCICGNTRIIATDSRCEFCRVQIRNNTVQGARDAWRYPGVDNWETVNILNVTHLSSEEAFKYITQHAQEAQKYMTPNTKQQIYNIRIESPFILTQRQIKEKFGVGFHVITVETERDIYTPHITDTDSAVEAMIRTGYRALARANHPDLGGDIQVMATINKAKKEILDLLGSLKS